MNDNHATVDIIKAELEPIFNYTKIRTVQGFDGKSTLKDISLNCSFKHFSYYFPNISRKALIKSLDFMRDHLSETQQAISEILEEDKQNSLIKN